MKKVFLDTCFLIHWVAPKSKYHAQAEAYMRYAVDQKYILIVSSIVLGEYAVRGDESSLMATGLFEVASYDYEHALLAAKLRPMTTGHPDGNRKVIINDVQILGQAIASGVDYMFTADEGMKKNLEYVLAQMPDCHLKVILMQDNQPPEDMEGAHVVGTRGVKPSLQDDEPLLPGFEQVLSQCDYSDS